MGKTTKRHVSKVGWGEPSETQRWNEYNKFQPTRLNRNLALDLIIRFGYSPPQVQKRS